MESPPLEASALFGRAAELNRINAHLEAPHAGRGPRALVMVGVPGIGKTRLLAEAVAQATVSPVRRLVGFEPEQSVPLAAAATLLRDLAAEPLDVAQRLTFLLASAAERADGLESLRLFEAATAVVLATTPSLLVIDDLQWLDDLSRALVHHVVRAATTESAPLLLLCASRPSAQSQAWVQSIRSLFEDGGRYDALELRPLDEQSGIGLAQARNAALSREAAEQIWAGADGSPFWISLQASGGAEATDPRRVLTERLRMLSDDTARCLAAVVVLSRPVTDEALAAVLGWPAERTAAAVGELVGRGLATCPAGVVATTHDLVRETAMGDVPEQERTRLHRRIADHLRVTADGDLAALMEAIEHATAGGGAATDLALQVAASPRRRLLGIDGFQRLADVAERPGLDDANRLRLTALLARLAEELGSHHAALTRLDWLSTALPDRLSRADAAVRAALQAFDLGDSTRAGEMLERARRDGEGDPWTLVSVDAVDFGRLVWLDHDAQTAAVRRRSAVDAARHLVVRAGGLDHLDRRQRAAYIRALDAERTGRLMDDDMDGLVVVTEELVDATRGFGEQHLDARAFTTMAIRFFNRWADVAERLVDVVAEAEQQVYPGVAAYAAYELALATYSVGDVATARMLHDKAARMGARVDELRQETSDTWLCGLRQLIDASGVDWRAAVAGLVAEAAVQDNAHCRLLLHQRAAMLAARFDPKGSRDFVVSEIDGANTDAAVAQCVRCVTEVEIVSVELLARVGETERARTLLDSWLPKHPDPKPRVRFFRDRAAALLAARTGDAAAAALLDQLAAAAAGDGLRLERVWALLDLAGTVADAGVDRAVAALTEAATLASTLGAACERGLADRELRALGVRAPAPQTSASPVLSLSRREAEVARLAVRGTRNAEIAASLFLSPKTVEQHLSRVFAKLGVRNRGELGSRYADDLG
jgi:DNA-binding CsgD family transcriptional regulator